MPVFTTKKLALSLLLYKATKTKEEREMKKLLFTACMILTMTSSIAASQVGESVTDCAEMIQASRNGNADVVAETEVAKEVESEATAK